MAKSIRRPRRKAAKTFRIAVFQGTEKISVRKIISVPDLSDLHSFWARFGIIDPDADVRELSPMERIRINDFDAIGYSQICNILTEIQAEWSANPSHPLTTIATSIEIRELSGRRVRCFARVSGWQVPYRGHLQSIR